MLVTAHPLGGIVGEGVDVAQVSLPDEAVMVRWRDSFVQPPSLQR